MDNQCSKCGGEGILPIETDENKYYYCYKCLKQALIQLDLLLYKNKEVRKLIKDIKRALKHEKNTIN